MNAVALIDSDTRKRIEKSRLARLIGQQARRPTEGEMERLGRMVRAVEPSTSGPFVGMHAVTLVRANLGALDRQGIASLKADGLHAHAAFVNCELALEQLRPAERRDTVLFVMRGAVGALPQVFAVDRVFHRSQRPVLLDGELCLRKTRLSPDECRAIKSGQNVHTRPYLQYPSATDAQAHADGTDITSDAYQSVYDAHFELVYAAFDCLYLNRMAQTNKPFADRIALVRTLTETSPIVDQTKRFREGVDQIRAAVEYAGGTDQFSLRVFMKPTFPIEHARAAMHAVPACMHGIGTDGVVFNNATDTYVVGTNERLLKWKPEHTADLVVLRVPATSDLLPCRFVLCAQNQGVLIPVSDRLLLDTPEARHLVEQYSIENKSLAGATVLECVGVYVSTGWAGVNPGGVAWRPTHVRHEKQAPNSVQTYENVQAAVADQLDEQAIVAYLTTK